MSARTKNQPRYQNLTPASEAGKRFTHWFSHGWDFIEKPNDPENGQKTKSWTSNGDYLLSPRQIWQQHQDPNTLIGLRFGQTTNYLVIDLDRGSFYHPDNDEQAFNRCQEVLETTGLCRPVIIRSSDSGGLHIYYFLPEPVNTYQAACLLRLTLLKAQLIIASGQLETFPNPKRYAKKGENPSLYNGHRLPLQPQTGSYLLDSDLSIISGHVEDLLNQADWAAAHQDIEKIKRRLKTAPSRLKKYLAKKTKRQEDKGVRGQESRFSPASPTANSLDLSPSAQVWKANLEQLLAEGWTGRGQTNYLLIKFVTYAIIFRKQQGPQLRETVKQMVVNAPGYHQYCRHLQEIDQRIEQICHHTEKNHYYLPYCHHPARNRQFSSLYTSNRRAAPPKKTSQNAQDRIIQAVKFLQQNQQLPQSVTERREAIRATTKELFEIAVSNQTLNKNLPLWHPQFDFIEDTAEPRDKGDKGDKGAISSSLSSQPTPQPAQPASEANLTTNTTPLAQKNETPKQAQGASLTTKIFYMKCYEPLDEKTEKNFQKQSLGLSAQLVPPRPAQKLTTKRS